MEIWRPVIGYGQNYSVSNFGNVRSERTKPGTRKGKVLKPYNVGGGYCTVKLTNGTKARNLRVHALVAEAFICRRPPGKVANHKNGDPSDNRPVVYL